MPISPEKTLSPLSFHNPTPATSNSSVYLKQREDAGGLVNRQNIQQNCRSDYISEVERSNDTKKGRGGAILETKVAEMVGQGK